jgi:transposase
MKTTHPDLPSTPIFTIGLDLGDRTHRACVLDHNAAIVQEAVVENTPKALSAFLEAYPKKHTRVVLEAGCHSPWISRHLQAEGWHALVANPRKLALISAETLARLARSDPKLLAPIRHRSEAIQADLRVMLTRDQLVRSRSALAHHLRGAVKSFGGRLPSGHPRGMPERSKVHLPPIVAEALQPMLDSIDALNAQIRVLDQQIQDLITRKYPQAERLQHIPGVGPLTALAFVLTVEDPARFPRTRDIGAFLGLVPRRDQSGQCDKQLRITKAGSPFMRKLLTNAAQHILGPFAPPSPLRAHGERIAARGGKNAKKRAATAVSRKLAVLMLAMLKSGQDYQPAQPQPDAA